MKISTLCSLILAGSVSVPAVAADLNSIYQQASQNDPQFRAAEAAYQASIEVKPQSRARLLPSLNLSAHYSETDDVTTGGSAPAEYSFNSNGYTLNLKQALYNHAAFVGLGQADAQVSAAEATLGNARQELIVRVASQYFNVLSAKDDLDFAQAEKTAIKEQLTQTQQRFNVGLTAITDVHEAQARYDQAVASEIVAQNALAIALESLREITGQEQDQLTPMSNEQPLPSPEPQDIAQWVSTALQNNAQLKSARFNMEASQDELSKTRAGHYPTLDLVANHTYTEYGDGAPIYGARENENTTVSVQLNMPILQGGQVNSQTRAAAARFHQAQEQHEQQRRATERQARSAYLSVIANISQVKALKQALASSQTALEATQAGFEVGTRTAVDVLDSQRELYRASRNYARSRYDFVLQSLRLKQAAGILEEKDLLQINAWLQ